ncbi:MAG: hypothetical protein HC875_05550 [Anaerolineales bacterium]|nr:hypothetical protein [Anaerolineales bacterium]
MTVKNLSPLGIAYFISPHGYGHAARSAAVMAALRQSIPTARFEVFTQVPPWFFDASLDGMVGYHPLMSDIGLAQKNSLVEDIPETMRRLAELLPFDPLQVERLADQVKQLGCRLVICDIAPLGIAVAKAAGLPALLIENFTWDWIYEGYLAAEAGLSFYINYLRSWFAAADYHIQTRPVCLPQSVHLTTGPVSRRGRTPAQATRQQLGLPAQAKAVLLTMGGIPWDYNTFLDRLAGQADIYFIIPGGSERVEQRGNLVLLPHHSEFYHPDLVNAVDAVIGKLGYSTVAEVYHAGIPFGYIPRPDFRESEQLREFVDRHINSIAVSPAQFETGAWLLRLPELLALPRVTRTEPNGAEQAARFIVGLLT